MSIIEDNIEAIRKIIISDKFIAHNPKWYRCLLWLYDCLDETSDSNNLIVATKDRINISEENLKELKYKINRIYEFYLHYNVKKNIEILKMLEVFKYVNWN